MQESEDEDHWWPKSFFFSSLVTDEWGVECGIGMGRITYGFTELPPSELNLTCSVQGQNEVY